MGSDNRYLSIHQVTIKCKDLNKKLSQVYWCSVILLPKTTIKDIEKVFKGFLWTGGILTKGKAKVAWKMVCKPQEEGGLGIRDLQTWNKALLTRQIWRLTKVKNSLWMDWVNIHHLHKHTFWEVKSKDLEGFSWSNMLALRDKLWKHIWKTPGDGNNINLWYDNWHSAGPLTKIIPVEEKDSHDLKNTMTLQQFCSNHGTGWPWGWDSRYPPLRAQNLPILQTNKKDTVWWRDREGNKKDFNPTQVWKDIRTINPTVSWYKVVWFKLNIHSHAFIFWLAIQDRLMTHERMLSWNTSNNLKCLFCKEVPDSIKHLFFDCKYSREVWKQVCKICFLHTSGTDMYQIVNSLQQRSHTTHIHTDIDRMAVAATIYFIWRERNLRYHNGSNIPHMKLANEIFNTLKARLCGTELKWSKHMEEVCGKWKIARPRRWHPTKADDHGR
ncbi:hypothetical protein LXL04_035656 [Taraxacum kok-saghyz]